MSDTKAEVAMLSNDAVLANPAELAGKISRQDIVDLLVHQQVESAEAEISRLNKEYEETRRVVMEHTRELTRSVEDLFRKKTVALYGKLFDVFSEMGAVILPVEEWRFDSDLDNHAFNKDKYQSLRGFVDYCRAHSEPPKGSAVYTHAKITADNEGFRVEQAYIHVHWRVEIPLDLIVKHTEGVVARIKEAQARANELNSQVHELQEKIANPEALARKLKAQWTANILKQAGLDISLALGTVP